MYWYIPGTAQRQIRRIMSRRKSAIFGEAPRNTLEKLGYMPDRANNLALGRKNRQLSKIQATTMKIKSGIAK